MSLQFICSSRWQLQLQTAVWRKPGGHRENDPVRQRASGPQRAALPTVRQERHSQKDAAGTEGKRRKGLRMWWIGGCLHGQHWKKVLWWNCAIYKSQFDCFILNIGEVVYLDLKSLHAYKVICSTPLPLVRCTFEVESWLALWVAVLLHSLCPLASVYVCVFRMHSVCWRTRTPGTAPWASSWTPCKERRSAPLSTALFWVRLLGWLRIHYVNMSTYVGLVI